MTRLSGGSTIQSPRPKSQTPRIPASRRSLQLGQRPQSLEQERPSSLASRIGHEEARQSVEEFRHPEKAPEFGRDVLLDVPRGTFQLGDDFGAPVNDRNHVFKIGTATVIVVAAPSKSLQLGRQEVDRCDEPQAEVIEIDIRPRNAEDLFRCDVVSIVEST